jgi:hypothetical protein
VAPARGRFANSSVTAVAKATVPTTIRIKPTTFTSSPSQSVSIAHLSIAPRVANANPMPIIMLVLCSSRASLHSAAFCQDGRGKASGRHTFAGGGLAVPLTAAWPRATRACGGREGTARWAPAPPRRSAAAGRLAIEEVIAKIAALQRQKA